MALIGNLAAEILLLPALYFLFICLRRWSKKLPRSSLPTEWPLIGMLPGLLCNANRIHDFASDILQQSGGTLFIKGPWFSNLDMLLTCDPANIHHILSKNFSNYPKGPQFNKIFDLWGDGISNADSELWKIQRKTTMSLLNHANFHKFLERTSCGKVEKGLIPILERAVELQEEVDLVELFQKFTDDSMSKLILGYDLRTLSLDLTHIPSEKAFDVIEEAILYRHILPEWYWKLQRWLQIGQEKRLHKAWETLDHLVAHCISLKRDKEFSKERIHLAAERDEDFDLLTSFMDAFKGVTSNPDKFLKDALLSLVFAARDTTSATLTWFFWLLTKNPSVEIKIREEIKKHCGTKKEKKILDEVEGLSKLVYLHGALCEALRLFPAVPFQHKTSLQPDVLPSGHFIGKNARVILSFYSVGRIENVWGENCLEFKPERWISDEGGIKHVPSFKFVAFNAGPRSCIGKDMSLMQMKIVAASIILHYHVEMVEGQNFVSPSNAVVLHMKQGLKVKVTKAVG